MARSGAGREDIGASPCRLVIGVAGGSGSGKSRFAEALAQRLHPRSVILLSEDDYYRRIDDPRFDPGAFDFDAPSARDHAQLAEHLARLRRGLPIARPIYSFRVHAPLKKTVKVAPAEVVVVEGVNLLHDARVRALLDFSIYLDVDDDVRFIRRLLRDTRQRGRSVRGVTDQYLATVKPAHQRFVEPTKALADLVLGWKTAAGRGDDGLLERWLEETIQALAGAARL